MNQVIEKTFRIGFIAKQLAVSVETIRTYEREGFLIPIKTAAGQRLFSEDDILWARCIRRLVKDEGLNFAGIRRLLGLLPCWELRPCSENERSQCAIFKATPTKPCWMLHSQIPVSCRSENCRTCTMYMKATQCNNLTALLFNLKHKLSNDTIKTNKCEVNNFNSNENNGSTEV